MGHWADHFMGVLYGKPQVMQRHRCAMHGRAYLPVPTRKKLAEIEAYIKKKMIEDKTTPVPAGTPISAHLVFVHKKPDRCPQSMLDTGVWSQKKWKKTTHRIMKTTKGDLDNLQKMILDGCTRGGLWYDDSQIVEIHAYDFYAGLMDEECSIFRFSTLTDHEPKKETGV